VTEHIAQPLIDLLQEAGVDIVVGPTETFEEYTTRVKKLRESELASPGCV
jgi:predicted Fe-Mo cluster-binding NifX family protein